MVSSCVPKIVHHFETQANHWADSKLMSLVFFDNIAKPCMLDA